MPTSPSAPMPDRPPGLSAPASAGIAAAAAALLGVHLELTVGRTGRALFTVDSAQFALAGRHLLRTGALATPFAHPAFLDALGPPPFPLLVAQPLVPLLDAAAFALGGAQPGMTLLPAALAYVATVVLVAWLALRIGRSRAAAVLAAAAFALLPAALFYAGEGLTEMPFAALWTGALVLVWELGGARHRAAAIGLGALLGLSHLARPIALPTLPVWLAAAAFAAPRGARLRAMIGVGLGFVPFALALEAWHWSVLGHPFADAGRYLVLTGITPELTVQHLNRSYPALDATAWLRAHPGALAHKVRTFLPWLLSVGVAAPGRSLTALGGLFVVFPRLGSEYPGRTRGDRAVGLALLGLLLVIAAVAAVSVPNQRFFFPLVPGLIALGVAGGWRLARAARVPVPALFLVGALAVLAMNARPVAWRWREAWRSRTPDRGAFTESEWRGFGRVLSRMIAPQSEVASDVAPWVSWSTGATSVAIPLTPAELEAMRVRVPVDVVVLSNEWMVDQPGEEAWKAVLDRGILDPHWTLAGRVASGRLRAVVLQRVEGAETRPEP